MKFDIFKGAIAPAREIPGDESGVGNSNDQFMKALQYFFTNVNLVLPVVAAVVVIVSAIVFICVFRARHAQLMKPGNDHFIFLIQKKLVEHLVLVKRTIQESIGNLRFLDCQNGWT